MRNPISENRALKAEVRTLTDRNAELEQDKRDLLTLLDEARDAIRDLTAAFDAPKAVAR